MRNIYLHAHNQRGGGVVCGGGGGGLDAPPEK